MDDELKQLSAVVHGRVQGVFFRKNTTIAARELQVSGWVRNLPDGSVEVLAIGTEDHLKQLLLFLSESPGQSDVTDIDVNWSSPEDEYRGFTVRYWAG
jgi:acylphosphatase